MHENGLFSTDSPGLSLFFEEFFGRHLQYHPKPNLRSGVPYIFCHGGKVPSRRDKKYKGRLITGYPKPKVETPKFEVTLYSLN